MFVITITYIYYVYNCIAIDHDLWTTYAIGDQAKWKQVTNNMAERGMGTMHDYRFMNATSLLKNYLQHVATTHMKRFNDDNARRALKDTNGNAVHFLTAYAEGEMVKVHESLPNYYGQQTNPNVYSIHKGHKEHKTRDVSADTREVTFLEADTYPGYTCTCIGNNGLICVHAYKALKLAKKLPQLWDTAACTKYIHPCYVLHETISQYARGIHLCVEMELLPNDLAPPSDETHRIQTKRIRSKFQYQTGSTNGVHPKKKSTHTTAAAIVEDEFVGSSTSWWGSWLNF